MLEVSIKKSLLDVDVVYFADKIKEDKISSDVVHYIYSSKSLPGARKVHTLCIDLSKDIDTIFKEMDRNARYHINKSEKTDTLRYSIQFSPSNEDVEGFGEFYNVFASNKCIGNFETELIKKIHEKNALVISRMMDEENNTLCLHAYIVDDKITLCKYSASHFRLSNSKEFRMLVGRANRLLHWMDMQSFKEKGYQVYDFGGLYMCKNNEKLNNVDRFKLEFGGTIVPKYSFYMGRNMIGSLALKMANKQHSIKFASSIGITEK